MYVYRQRANTTMGDEEVSCTWLFAEADLSHMTRNIACMYFSRVHVLVWSLLLASLSRQNRRVGL